MSDEMTNTGVGEETASEETTEEAAPATEEASEGTTE